MGALSLVLLLNATPFTVDFAGDPEALATIRCGDRAERLDGGAVPTFQCKSIGNDGLGALQRAEAVVVGTVRAVTPITFGPDGCHICARPILLTMDVEARLKGEAPNRIEVRYTPDVSHALPKQPFQPGAQLIVTLKHRALDGRAFLPMLEPSFYPASARRYVEHLIKLVQPSRLEGGCDAPHARWNADGGVCFCEVACVDASAQQVRWTCQPSECVSASEDAPCAREGARCGPCHHPFRCLGGQWRR
jgi:hypothetical protein